MENQTEKTKIKKPRVTFEENLAKIKDLDQPLPTSALYALSAMTPERQTQFEAIWPGLDAVRKFKVAASMLDLTEELAELDFSSVYVFLLHDSDPRVRAKAVEGLAEDESRAVLGEFLKLLENEPSPEVREKVALNLAHFALFAETGRLPQRWVDRLRDTLLGQAEAGKNPPEIERRVIEALGYFNNNEQVTKIIERAYRSENEMLKAAALRAIGRNINPRWLPELGKEMSSPLALHRYEAATASGEMGSKELLPSLLRLSEDSDRQVRLAAIWALGQVGGPEAQRTLRVLVKSENSAEREAAQEALKDLAFAENPLNPLGGEI